MRFTATLETFDDGSCLGWVHELPGCAARARHRTEIERALAAEIRGFLAEGGDAVPDAIELAIAAESEVAGGGPEATAALIEPDRVPLDPLAWARIAHRLGLSRQRLLDGLAEAEQAGDAAAVRDVARHVGLIELLLAAQTFDTASDDGLRGFLAWTRSIAMARLTEAAATDAGIQTGTGVAGAASGDGQSPPAEAWSVAKVARRLVWHERLHLPRS